MATAIFVLSSIGVLWQSLMAINAMGRCTVLRHRAAYCALAIGAFGNVASAMAGVPPSYADVVFAVGVCGAVALNRPQCRDMPGAGPDAPDAPATANT